MRKQHLKETGETRSLEFRGRLSPTERTLVISSKEAGGYESFSDLLIAGCHAIEMLSGITGDITGDGDSVTSDEWLSPVTSPVMAGAVRLPIVPPRPLVGEEIAYCRELHRNGMSKNQLCVNFFGGKNPRRMSFITEALDEH